MARKSKFDFKTVRNKINLIIDIADRVLENEKLLIEKLAEIDQTKEYSHSGYNSLTGFCRFSLRFSKTQTQRLVTQARRLPRKQNQESENILQ